MGSICGQTLSKMADFNERTAVVLEESDVPGAKLSKHPSQCLVEELQRWLECHNLKKSGKKDELIERVSNALTQNLPLDPKIDGGKWYNLKSIQQTDPEGSQNRREPLLTGWKPFPSRNRPPNFNYGHVYYYLVESIDTTRTTILTTKPSNNVIDDDSDYDDDPSGSDGGITAKSLRKGRWLLKSNFVEDVQDNFNSSHNEYMLRAHVQHSMKNLYPLNVLVYISNASGAIKDAECDCKASSLGRCAHVAVVLLMLSDSVATYGSVVDAPSTSQPCTWNKGKKRTKNPQKVHLATYSSSKRKRPSCMHTWDPRPKIIVVLLMRTNFQSLYTVVLLQTLIIFPCGKLLYFLNTWTFSSTILIKAIIPYLSINLKIICSIHTKHYLLISIVVKFLEQQIKQHL